MRFGKEEGAPSVDLSVDKDGNYTFEGLSSSSEPFTPLPWKSGTGNAHRNVFDDTDLTVRKVWEDDNDNIYGSRPASEDPSKDWEVVFLIQSREQGSDDESAWQAVTVRDVGFGETTETTHDLTVTIRGSNSEGTAENPASVTIRSLPGKNIAGKTLEYRAVELQPGAEPDYDADDIVSDGGTFYGTYTVAYVNSDGTTTATNTLKRTEISAEKKWNVQEEGRPPSPCTCSTGRWRMGRKSGRTSRPLAASPAPSSWMVRWTLHSPTTRTVRGMPSGRICPKSCRGASSVRTTRRSIRSWRTSPAASCRSTAAVNPETRARSPSSTSPRRPTR